MTDISTLSKSQLFQIKKTLTGRIGDTSIERGELEKQILSFSSWEKVIPNQPQTEEVQPMRTDPKTEGVPAWVSGMLQAIESERKATVSEDKVKEIVLSLITKREVPTITVIQNSPEVVHEAFERVSTRVQLDIPVLLTGPAGCGKTHLAEQIAESLNLPFSMLSMSEGASEAHLLGYILPDEKGAFTYRASGFVRAYAEGGLFLLDELDAADPNTLLVLNSALANGKLTVPQANRTFDRHPNFRIIATANTMGTGATMEYAGRNRLDAATLDRFKMGIVTMDYDQTLESTIIQDKELIAFARKTREVIKTKKLPHILSTRSLVAMQKLAAIEGVESVKESYLVTWTKEERGAL